MDAMFNMPQNWHFASRALHLARLKNAATEFFNGLLGQNTLYDFSVDVGQTALDAVVVEGQAGVVDAQEMQDRGMKVGPGDAVLDGFPANFVRRTIGEAGLEARAGEPDGEAVLVVVAAGADFVGGRLRERSAAKFGREED